jgi:hypothetical protein
MSDVIPNVSATVYGGVDAPYTQGTRLGGSTSASTIPTMGPSVPASTVGEFVLQREGGLANAAAEKQYKSTAWESAAGAASQWLPSKLYQAEQGPSNEVDTTFSPRKLMELLPFAPNEDQREYLFKARNPENGQFRLQQLVREHQANEAVADNPGIGVITTLVDPSMFAIDIVSAGAGHAAALARAGRVMPKVVAGGTGALIQGGLSLATEDAGPLNTKDILAGMFVQGSFSALSFHSGTMVPKDLDFPAKELRANANALASGGTKRVVASAVDTVDGGVAVLDQTVRAVDETIVMPKASNGVYAVDTIEDVSLYSPTVKSGAVKLDSNAKAVYLPADDMVFLVKSNIKPTDDVKGIVLHEVGVHMNAERVLGTERLTQMYRTLEDQLMKDNPRVKQAFADVPPNTPAHLVREEALGYYVERFHKELGDSIINTFVTAVKDKLRKWGVADLKYSEADVMSLVRKAAKAQVGPKDAAVAGLEVRYSKPLAPLEVKRNVMASFDSDTTANGIAWNAYKSASRFSKEARNIMRELVDDPVDMRADSAISQKTAIMNDFQRQQAVVHEKVLEAMAERGYTGTKRIFKYSEAMRAQRTLEREITIELANREAGHARIESSAIVNEIADEHVKLMHMAVEERVKAAVSGFEVLQKQPGYLPRKWQWDQIERIQQRLVAQGLTEAGAQAALVDLVARGIRDIPDAAVRSDVAKAILDRARRKGMFEDSAFRGSMGDGGMQAMEDTLRASGLPEERIKRVLDALIGHVDEAGKTSSMKARVSMDMRTKIDLPDGSSVGIVDMIDSNALSLTANYLNQTAGEVALARKGYRTASEIAALRSRYAESIPNMSDRADGIKRFDDFLDDIQGRPSGEQLPELMRTSALMTQLVGLAGAGIWQIADYATLYQKYGATAATKHFLKEMPVLRSLMNDAKHNAESATQLKNILAENSNVDFRMRPFLQRMEDNFDIPASHELNIALSNTRQLVPYVNGLKYVHGHQARMAGNLITDTFHRAAKGDAKAVAMLERYGLESHVLDTIKSDIALGGMDTAKWSAGTWEKVRGPLGKMMDEAVLKSRTGEVPHFAQFSQVGKFLFTFRSFVLAAHNKLLAGTLGRDGYAGLGLLMLYQYPLAVLANAANNTIQGKKPLTDAQLFGASVGQMSALGMFSELWNIASGESTKASTPGLIALDRLLKVGTTARAGIMKSANDGLDAENFAPTAGALLNIIPVVSAFGPIKAINEHLKGANNGAQ